MTGKRYASFLMRKPARVYRLHPIRPADRAARRGTATARSISTGLMQRRSRPFRVSDRQKQNESLIIETPQGRFKDVSGIGNKTFESIREYLTVS